MGVRDKVRTTAVVIGTIVGAGFATGEEINLFFGTKTVFSPIISAFFFALFTYVFMLFGRVNKSKVVRRTIKVAVNISAIVVLLAMCACLSELIFAHFGVVVALLLYYVVRKGNGLGIFNEICVPFIIAFIIIIAVCKGRVDGGEGVGLLSAVSYPALNFMTAGYLLGDYGKRATNRDCATVAIWVGILSGILLFAVRCAVFGTGGNIPLLTASRDVGLDGLAKLLIVFAVVTTLSSCMQVINDVHNLINSSAVSVALVLSLAYIGECLGFEFVVVKGYPLISAIGVIYVVYALLCILCNQKAYAEKSAYAIK